MSMLLTIVAHILGIGLFLFFYWRTLKEDYTSEQIFSTGFIIIGCALLGSLIASYTSHFFAATRIFSPRGLWFWGGAIGIVLGIFIALRRHKLRLFETIEISTIGSLVWLLALSIRAQIWMISIILFVIVVLFFYLKKNYRRFNWYKSGKVGFAGLTSLAIFFLLRAISAIFFYDPMLSFGKAKGFSIFIGRVDAIVSATVAFCFILYIYNLSKSK